VSDPAPVQRASLARPGDGAVPDVVEIGNRYYVLADSGLADDHDQVLMHQDTFGVFDRYGDIKPVGLGEEGVYHDGTRHLSTLLLRLGDERPLLLGSTARRDNARLSVDLTNPDMQVAGRALAHSSVHIGRTKVLWDGVCHERLVVRNFALHEVDLELVLHFGADFADIFEVRGMERERRGQLHPPEVAGDAVSLAYDGLDGVHRVTRLAFDPAPDWLGARAARFRLTLDAGRASTLDVAIACRSGDEPQRRGIGFEAARDRATGRREAGEHRGAALSTTNVLATEWLDRSTADLAMMTTETRYGPYPYAGVPWYSTVFGRDALFVGRQTLWLMPELTRGILRYLAAYQADHDDPETDAQPGKILHEVRHSEMARTGEVPFARYYGSHDATPLFVGLAAAHLRQTGDMALARELWPHVERALAWMDGAGDPDGDGFLEYRRRTSSGLIQQGWKDSHDSVFHADGHLAQGPIALCEIQGYAYEARLGAAAMADALGLADRADALRAQAASLQRRFDQAFWLEDLGTYAMALDGEKRPTRVRTSNPGHCLATGIVPAPHGERVAATLLDDASFSGWGVRTVAAGEARYNPMSYHDGSVWPHDTAMAAFGLGVIGDRDGAARLFGAMFDAARQFDLMRLPELFGGFSRREGEAPTLYPVACSPQAWASGAPFMMLEACLGLSVDAAARRVTFDRARLPLFLDQLRIEDLPVGPSRLDLVLERQEQGVGVNVLANPDDVLVTTVK
jgi:glycogen debranching enzyme